MTAAFLFFNCFKQPLDLPDSAWNASVPAFTAVFDGKTVVLTWVAPSEVFDYYKIYRTSKTDTLGLPDTSSLVSTEARSVVDKSLTSFNDILEPAEGIYYYSIRAVKNINGSLQLGSFFPLVACTVGTGVSFSINYGDVYTKTNICNLILKDPRLQVASVRFAEITIDSLDTSKYGTGKFIPLQEKVVRIRGNDEFNQLTDMYRERFFDVSAAASNVKHTPDFGATDPLNTTVTRPNAVGVNTVNSFPWVLSEGRGQKTVFTEVTYKNGVVDTILDMITTMPHKVDITFRNKTGSGFDGATSRDTSEPGTKLGTFYKIKLFYTTDIQFSVKIFGDAAIDTAFDYWLMTDSFESKMDRVLQKSNNWFMTKPRKTSLTGIGDLHDPVHPYPISIDTVKGADMFEVFKKIKADSACDVTASLTGKLNRFNFVASKYVYQTARKQFYLVVRLKDIYFNDKFIQVYGFEDAAEVIKTYTNYILPTVRISTVSAKNPDRLPDGSVIVQPFNFALDSLSIYDTAFALITDIRLLISKMPDTFVLDTSNISKISPQSITAVNRYMEFIYPVQTVKSRFTNVRWDNIDPREWPSGKYLMGVCVGDEYGRYGFAGYDDQQKDENKISTMNPWMVEIKTAK